MGGAEPRIWFKFSGVANVATGSRRAGFKRRRDDDRARRRWRLSESRRKTHSAFSERTLLNFLERTRWRVSRSISRPRKSDSGLVKKRPKPDRQRGHDSTASPC